jgi:hypothetical protein
MFAAAAILLNRRWTRVHRQLWTKGRARRAKKHLVRIRSVEEVLRQPYYTIIADEDIALEPQQGIIKSHEERLM